MGTQGTTIVPLGCQWHPSIPILELCWAPLVAPGPLWARFGMQYGASERTSRCARIPAKVWILAHFGTARVPLQVGLLPPIQLPRRLSGARRQLGWAPPALSWGAVGANLVWTSGLFKKKKHFLRNSSAPGSEAARDKWLVQKKTSFV